MSIQTDNPKIKKNIRPFEKMTGNEVDAASQISNQKKTMAAFQDKLNNEIEEMEDKETKETLQRKPQFRLCENNRRRFS